MSPHLLTLDCPDRAGIVARISAELFHHGGNILEASQFDDVETGRFFTRIEFGVPSEAAARALAESFDPLARQFDMNWCLRRRDARQKVLLMVSRFDHCLADLLYRWRIDELAMDPVAIIGNHPRSVLNGIDLGDIPYHHLPVTPPTKAAQEDRVRAIIAETGAELVVLARYMQVLSNDLSAELAGRCINIHHSFLPGFKGAKPYHQAHARGVKLIGATAHYVTTDLDEGPIIEQDIERITHADTPDTLVRKGRDIERRVLARAVGAHLAGRVFLNGQRTVVFRD